MGPPRPGTVRLLPPPPYKPSESELLIGRWRAFLGTTDLPVFNVAEGAATTYAAWCPVCRRGIVTVAFPRVEPPTARLDGCSAGCTFEQLVKAAASA